MDRVKRIWYLSPMRAAKVQASLRIRAVSPEPPLLAHTSSESRGTFREKARSLALLNGRACAVEICHDGMLEDTNSLDGAQMVCVCLSWDGNWEERLWLRERKNKVLLRNGHESYEYDGKSEKTKQTKKKQFKLEIEQSKSWQNQKLHFVV